MHRRGSCHRAAARLDKCLSFPQQGCLAARQLGAWDRAEKFSFRRFGCSTKSAFDAGWGLWVGGLTLTGRHWKELNTPTVKCQCMTAVRRQPQLLHWTPGDTDISSMTLTPDQYDSDPNADIM